MIYLSHLKINHITPIVDELIKTQMVTFFCMEKDLT